MAYPISDVTRRVVYSGSAGTGPYSFSFEILNQTDIAVYKNTTLLTLTTNYTVTINSNGTGSVTLVSAATGSDNITIVGDRGIQRTTDFVTGGDLFANTLNQELDALTIYSQQVDEKAERGLKAPVTDPTDIAMTLPSKTSRANKTLAFDTNGNPTTGEAIGDNRGNWAAATSYNKRDIVKDTTNGNIYYANTSHTSSGSLPISTNTDSAKWDLIVDNASAGASATAAASSASAAATSASNASTSASNASSSASTASTQASNASTSASNASTSATNAASSASAASSSASTASTAATNASNSASAAATSATNASNSASAASTSASNASSSASAASTSASNASTSATNAANSASSATSSASTATTQAGIATTQASNASTSATNAANSASAAATSETNAATSAAAAAAALDNFDDRYLGAKSSNPTVDNDGNALLTGALYYRTTAPIGMKVYDGSQWLEASAAQQAALVTYEYVATAGQTSFSGADANSLTLSYIAGGLIVSLNGVILRPGDDYTATNGTTVVLTSAAALNDEVVMYAFSSFQVANTYTQAQTDALLANKQASDSELTTLAGMSADRATFLAGTQDFGFRNRIINGNMVIDQRNAGASVTPTVDGQYGGPDRWGYWLSQASKFSVQQSTVAPTGFSNSVLVTSLSSYAVTGNDYFGVIQKIEGFNFADLMWGTANAQTITVSFWVRSSLTGTFGGAMTNNAFNRSYPFSYTISAANTWEQKTVTIAGDTTGTWVGSTNGVGTILQFSLGAVSGRLGTAGAWAANWFVGSTGATSVVGTNGATFYITGVQLEAGTVASPFERIDYGRQLIQCQRYCEVLRPTGVTTYAQLAIGQNEASTSGTVGYFYQVAKRAQPTVTYDTASKYAVTGSGGSAIALTSISTARADTTSLAIGFGVASGLTAGNATRLLDNNTSYPVTIISAEL